MLVTMTPDDKICYCYNVSRRKLESFARRVRPARPSQMSECLGAGTGCGWCIPFLKQIAAAATEAATGDTSDLALSPEEYAEKRKSYINTKQPKNKF